jgi:flagellar motor switch protein FliM
MSSDESFLSGQEVLSQSEVERLLAQVAEQETNATIHKADGSAKVHSKDSIQPYDFRLPVFLSQTELRKARTHHEEFIRSLAARLSMYLRLEFGLQMSKLQTLPYQKFVESLGNPAHLVLFKVEPLQGICVLDINPRLGLSIVDRLMGGPGHSVNLSRDLTEIEVALLDQAVDIILGEWCARWAGVMELRPGILAHETNGRFLNTSHADTIVLALSMEARVADCVEQIQIGFPYPAIEPLVRKLGEKLDNASDGPARSATPARWNKELESIPIRLSAEWPKLEIAARDLARLRVGDVLQWDEDAGGRVEVRVARQARFEGRLGTRGKKWAIEITRAVKS